jgi:hypothetical protein
LSGSSDIGLDKIWICPQAYEAKRVPDLGSDSVSSSDCAKPFQDFSRALAVGLFSLLKPFDDLLDSIRNLSHHDLLPPKQFTWLFRQVARATPLTLAFLPSPNICFLTGHLASTKNPARRAFLPILISAGHKSESATTRYALMWIASGWPTYPRQSVRKPLRLVIDFHSIVMTTLPL